MARRPENPDSEGFIVTYTAADDTFIERQKYEKELEVRQALREYDKDHIVEVHVYLEDSDDEIVSANILVESNDGIADADKQNEIKAVASEHLNLDAQNINLVCVDRETFMAEGVEK